LARKLEEEGINNKNKTRKAFQFEEELENQDEVDDIDEVLSMRPEKLDI
jgi:hypothetical protein